MDFPSPADWSSDPTGMPEAERRPNERREVSISWLWVTVAIVSALLVGLVFGNAIAGDDAARTLADKRAHRVEALTRQLTRLRHDARTVAVATTTTSTTTLPPTTTSVPAPVSGAPAFVAPGPAPAAPSGSTYYPNCAAARAAGAAPVHVGEPGYGRHLDRDGDGIGCE